MSDSDIQHIKNSLGDLCRGMKSIKANHLELETKLDTLQNDVSRINKELIGDVYGNRPSYKSRLSNVETMQANIIDKIKTVEREIRSFNLN
jgi:chromosome segregation ATPase